MATSHLLCSASRAVQAPEIFWSAENVGQITLRNPVNDGTVLIFEHDGL
jgi:hypothetical protein